MLVQEQRRDRHHAEPVEDADVEPEPSGGEQRDRRDVEHARAAEHAAHAEARRPRVQALRAGRPRRRRASRRGRSPAIQSATAAPSTHACHGSSPVIATQAPTGASPSTAPSQRWREPGEALEVGVDDEAARPGSARASGRAGRAARRRRGRPASESAQNAHTCAGAARRAAAPAPAVRGLRASISGVDQPVERHRERARAHHRDGDPEQVAGRRARRRRRAARRRRRTGARRPCARS